MSTDDTVPIDAVKVATFDTPAARKTAFDKAREAAQRQADAEEEARQAVLEEFQQEYGPVEQEAPPSKRPAAAAFPNAETEADEERARRRQRQRSGASYLDELKTMSKKRKPVIDLDGGASEKYVPTVKLYCLPDEMRQSALVELLSPYAGVRDVRMGHGSATITFVSRTDADLAKAGIQGTYLGGGCWLQTTPQSRPEHAFNARPKQVNLARVAPPSMPMAAARLGPALEVRVARPSLAMLRRIHNLIEGIVQHGPAMEALVRQRQYENPDYAFLFSTTSSNAIYFRYRLCLAQQGQSILTRPQYLFDDNTLWFPPSAYQDPDDEQCTMQSLGKITASDERCLLSVDARMRLYHLLRTINGERRSIAALSLFAVSHPNHVHEIVDIYTSSFQPDLSWKVLMARLWSISDILHNTSLPIVNLTSYRAAFEHALTRIVPSLAQAAIQINLRIRRDNFCKLVVQLLSLWRERAYFSDGVIDRLESDFQALIDAAEPGVDLLAGEIQEPSEEEEDGAINNYEQGESAAGIPSAAYTNTLLPAQDDEMDPQLSRALDEYEEQYNQTPVAQPTIEPSSLPSTRADSESQNTFSLDKPKIKLAFGTVKKAFRPNFAATESTEPDS